MNIAFITTGANKIVKARKELINRLKETNNHITVMGPEAQEICQPVLEKHGLDYKHLNIDRNRINPLKEMISLRDAKRKFQACNIDVVLVYGIRMMPSIVLAASFAKVKLIVCVVNGAGNIMMDHGLKGKLLQLMSFPMLWLAFKKADAIIFQNSDDFKDLRKIHLISKNNTCLSNGSGVNLEDYKEFPLPDEAEFLLVSRITGSKGINEYVQAAKIVKTRYPNTKFGLVGPNDDSDGSVNWDAIEHAVNDNVLQYYGETNNVQKYLKNCRIYVFPSYYREGVPRSVLEAMATGRPIITTDSWGCRETVENGVNGFLIPPRNVNALVEKMIWMIEHPCEVESMAKASRRIVEKKFDVHKVNAIVLREMQLN